MFSWIVSSLRRVVHFCSRVFTPRSVVAASSAMSLLAFSWSSFSKASASTFSLLSGLAAATAQVVPPNRVIRRLLRTLLAKSHPLHTRAAQDVVHAQAPHRPRDRARKLRRSGRPRAPHHPAPALRGRDAGLRYIRVDDRRGQAGDRSRAPSTAASSRHPLLVPHA